MVVLKNDFISTDKLVVSTSCSLLHTAVDIVNETKLDEEIKSWLAFAAQKLVEVSALAKALVGNKNEVLNGILSPSPKTISCIQTKLKSVSLKGKSLTNNTKY